MAAGIIGRRNADHDAAVGIALIARILAHAIGHNPSRFRRGGNDSAARTHAETVDRTAIAAVMHQFVIGRTQCRVTGEVAEAATIDQRLRMFDAKADRKRLGFNIHTALVQHLEGIARAVANRQHYMVGCNMVASGQRNASYLAIIDVEIVNLALEAEFAAQFLDRRAHQFDHLH